MENRSQIKKQLIKIEDKNQIEINGVDSIIGFDEEYVSLDGVMGRIIIEGRELKVIDLSKETGKIIITGCFYSLSYDEKTNKKGRGLFG